MIDYSSYLPIITPILIGLTLLFALLGGWRGLSGEIAGFCAVVIGGMVSYYAYPYILDMIVQYIDTVSLNATIYSFLIALAIFIILRKLTAIYTKKLLNIFIDQPWNALLGALFGAIKVILIASIVIGELAMNPKKSRIQTIGRFWKDVGTTAIDFIDEQTDNTPLVKVKKTLKKRSQ